MKRALACLVFFLSTASPVLSQQALIGVAAPLSGPSAILGEQVRDGAITALTSEGAAAATVAIVEDDACTAQGGKAAAAQFVKKKVAAVIGFLCMEALEAALPALKEADIPVITVGVRADGLTDRREKTGWPVWRLAPRNDEEAAGVAAIIPRIWRKEPFAIIDDGTIHARDVAEALRSAAGTQSLKPVFLDVFRPQLDNQIGLVGRLRKSGATHIYASGDRDDVAIMARDAASLEAGLTFAGGEVLRGSGEKPLQPGTVMIGLPDWRDHADPAVLLSLGARDIIAEGYVLPAYAAAQIALQAIADNAANPGAELDATTFSTAIGSVRFNAKGDMTPSPYGAYLFDGARFVPLGDG